MPDITDQLGSFLRSRRERFAPNQVGLAATRRRRTPGLRREEVAGLAGISAEWYVKLEQGRAVAPSSATIDALAAALRLSPEEHAHLRRLARPEHRPCFARETVPASLERFIQSLGQPAYIVGLRWDLLVWNPAAQALFGALIDGPESERNILVGMLTDPCARALFGLGWNDEARRMTALFRSTHDVWAADPAFTSLVARIHKDCPDFYGWWNTHDIGVPASGIKSLDHPDRGITRYEYVTFQSNDDNRLKVCVFTEL